MISYAPLWETLQKRQISKYTLRLMGIGGGTFERLRKGETVSTSTIDALCNILDCDIPDIIAFIKD